MCGVKPSVAVKAISKDLVSTLSLLVVCAGMVLLFGSRFPAQAPRRDMPPTTVESYFNGGWEGDASGGFVWVLDDDNKIIVANNTPEKITGQLKLEFLGAPCGEPHDLIVSSAGRAQQKITVDVNKSYSVDLALELGRFERLPVDVKVLGLGCIPNSTESRELKVQFRQPIFLTN